MKKKNIFLTIGILAFITGCNYNESDAVKEMVQIKYNGNNKVYECSEEEKSNLKSEVNIVVKENQLFAVIENSKKSKTYEEGTHELKANPNAKTCFFVDSTPIENNKYGTQSPIMKNHPEYGVISIAIHGNFTYRVNDAVKFLDVYNQPEGYISAMRTYLINYYSIYVSETNYNTLIQETKMDQQILDKVNKDIEKYGLEITESIIEGFEVTSNTGEIIFTK